MQTKILTPNEMMAYIIHFKYHFFPTTTAWEVRKRFESQFKADPPSSSSVQQAVQWWNVMQKMDWGIEASADYNKIHLAA